MRGLDFEELRKYLDVTVEGAVGCVAGAVSCVKRAVGCAKLGSVLAFPWHMH